VSSWAVPLFFISGRYSLGRTTKAAPALGARRLTRIVIGHGDDRDISSSGWSWLDRPPTAVSTVRAPESREPVADDADAMTADPIVRDDAIDEPEEGNRPVSLVASAGLDHSGGR
jgi:hypothetical protein